MGALLLTVEGGEGTAISTLSVHQSDQLSNPQVPNNEDQNPVDSQSIRHRLSENRNPAEMPCKDGDSKLRLSKEDYSERLPYAKVVQVKEDFDLRLR